MQLAIPWPEVSVTPEFRTGGVISYSRAESSAACCLVIPGLQGTMCKSISSQSGDSGPEEGGRVPWWEHGQTSFVYCKRHRVCIWSPVLPRHRTKCTRNQEGS